MEVNRVVTFETYYTYQSNVTDKYVQVISWRTIRWEDIEYIESYDPSQGKGHDPSGTGVVIGTFNRDPFVALDVDRKEVIEEWQNVMKMLTM